MEIEKIIDKITQYRSRKGYTYENMADELELTPAAYRKIETGETKLTVERLFRISAILETPIEEFLNIDKNAFVQNNYNNESIFQQKIENFYQENKEITEQLIRVKDELIEQLKNEIQYLRDRNK
ncbi:helix-turn-helix transcriptional regulator [Bergeyella zoohelcum]|uniref:Helix-turn-helix domain n=1 Tax=Bergeyella zoohelcum TaxID=1015 RepID=A0A7Z8YQG5_9FLAO|nr:helix-turn-helix transcriptional regulator [Bergeyella zoohelcum]VDH03661.1 Helix-turn-helix domain [Bergeyella zoohelcum]